MSRQNTLIVRPRFSIWAGIIPAILAAAGASHGRSLPMFGVSQGPTYAAPRRRKKFKGWQRELRRNG